MPVIDASKKLNSRNKALPIATYDFSTLYTNIPNKALKNVKIELVSFWFKGGGKNLVLQQNLIQHWLQK